MNRIKRPLSIALSVYLVMTMLLGFLYIIPKDLSGVHGEQLMEENVDMSSSDSLRIRWNRRAAQSFEARGDYVLTRISLYVMDQTPEDNDLTVELWSNNPMGADPFDDVPDMFLASDTNNGKDDEWEWLDFSISYSLIAGLSYWIVVNSNEAPGMEGYYWRFSQGDQYKFGFAIEENPPGWAPEPQFDCFFRVYGDTEDDVGVKEINAPKSQDLYVGIDFTSIIKNFGTTGPWVFDVECRIYDPYGMEIFYENRPLPPLDSGVEMEEAWFFIPVIEGVYTININTEGLPVPDHWPFNDLKEFFIEVKALAVLKLHDEITIDGIPNDWNGNSAIPDDSWQTDKKEFIWRDALGDDYGYGDYVYPTDSKFEVGCLDLLEFRTCVDSDSINFLLEFKSIDYLDNPALGFSDQVVQILIDTDRDGTGRTDTIRNARLKLDQNNAWEYALYFDGYDFGYIEEENGYTTKDELAVVGDAGSNTIEVSIPAIGPGIPDFKKWGYTVLIGAYNDLALPFAVEGSTAGFTDIDVVPTSKKGGGGFDGNFPDPNVYDIAFASPQEPQLDNFGYEDLDLISFTTESPTFDANTDYMEYWAQSFIAPKTCAITEVEIYAKDIDPDSTSSTIKIMSNNPFGDIPSDVIISSVEITDFPSGSYGWSSVSLSHPAVVDGGQTYWIVLQAFENASEGYQWGGHWGDQFPEGMAAQHMGSSWIQFPNEDLLFKVRYKDLTDVDAHHTTYFAPLVINQVYVNGAQDDEWIELFYNGTLNAPDLDMNGWVLTDQDGNNFNFPPTFSLQNKKNVTIHTGFGSDSPTDLFWGLTADVWDDFGDDVLLTPDMMQAVDYINYTDKIVYGDPPPVGINWGPEGSESLPKNPKSQQTLYLSLYGNDNDLYKDWRIKATGRIGNKSLYFHDDGSFTGLDPYDHMNTIVPNGPLDDFDKDGKDGLTLKKASFPLDVEEFQDFNLTPVLARSLDIAGDVVVDLWLDDEGAAAWQTVDVILYNVNGPSKVEVDRAQKQFLSDTINGWEKITVNITDVFHTLDAGDYLVCQVMANVSSSNDLLLAYNTSSEPSGIKVLPTRTFVNVDWARTYDLTEVETTDFGFGQDVLIKANVSDPFGSYDVLGANITIIKPSAPGGLSENPMTLELTDPNDPSAWKLFNYTFTDTDEAGAYSVRIKGIESNGVTHRHTIYFNVLANNPPELSGQPLIPTSGNTTQKFNFSVDYKDLDNDPPSSITVNITDYGTMTLFEFDPLDTDYTDGKIYYRELSGFVFGTSYPYHFAASDTKGYWVETAGVSGPQIINSPPTLSNPGIDKPSGNASTTFTYTVTYTDLDNHAPGSIKVNISGPAHAGEWDMVEVDPGDNDYTDGKLYEYIHTGFVNGSYEYNFAATDSEGAWAATSKDQKPLVINSIPILMGQKVTPDFGTIETDFTFMVTYYDLDDHAPANILVNISGPSRSGSWIMIEVDSGDTNYIDGKEYYYTDTNFIIGSYQFKCAASDSQGAWRETPWVLKPIVYNTRPTLTDHNLNPTVGDAGFAFNYSVTYNDLDNQAPGNITVNISGPFSGNFTMVEVDPSDTNFTDGKEYFYNVTIPLDGNYSYRIDAYDNGSLWAISIVDNGPNVGSDAPPVLSQPNVNPDVGITITYFNFTVNFIDPQNDSAGFIFLNLTGPSGGLYLMSEVDPSDDITSDGKWFYYNSTDLMKGSYSFNFQGTDEFSNYAESTSRPDPIVQNSPPWLSGVSTNISNLGGSWFNFTATYLDLDNDFASVMDLNITGLGVYPMTELDPLDLFWKDGKDFYCNITIPKGSYSYTFWTRDSGLNAIWNATSPVPFTLINNVPVISNGGVNPITGFGGDLFNFSVDVTDSDSDIVLVRLFISGEPGSPFIMSEQNILDLDTSDGKGFYFEIMLPKGNYNYNFTVFDGTDANQTPLDILNVKNNVPSITTIDVTNTLEDSFHSVDYDYIDLDLDPITWNLDTNASWLNFNSLTGEIYGTPNNNDVGSYYVNISCDDGDGGLDFHNFSLIVINTLPVITTPPTIFSTEDLMHIDDFNCVDDGQGIITYSFTSNATWLSIIPNSGLLSGTPDNTNVGWYWVNVSVDDGNGGIYSMNYTLTVNNTPPSILTVPLQFAIEDSLHLDDFTCDDDLQGTIDYYLLSNGSWLSLNPFSGILSGTPRNADVGWIWVNVSVTDGNGGMDFINYTITIFNINDAPVITTLDMVMALQDMLYSVDYEATDVDPTNDVLIWSMQTNASWLSLDPPTGFLNGTPTNSDIGSYWVNIKVTDGKGGWDNSNFTLTVTDTNDPPFITTSDISFATEDVYYVVDYNFTDIDDPIVTWYLETNSSWLSIDPASGLLYGTPDNGDVGSFWVNVTVNDGRGGIDFSNFTITVTNAPPVITNLPGVFAQEDVPFTDDFDCDDDLQGSITYLLSTNASWLVIDPAIGELSGTPDNTQVGWFWVNVTVLDGNYGSDFVNYTLTVYNSIPQIVTLPLKNTLEDTQYVEDFDCVDDGQGIITYSLSTDAGWLSVDPLTGVINGTPKNNHVGTFWVNVTVSDGNGGIHFLNYSLLVNNTPPQITTTPGISSVEDIEYIEDFNCDDDGQGSITYKLNSNASWLSIDPITGVLNGTPQNSDVGYYFVNITVDDGNGGSDSVNYTLTVTNSNDPPQILTGTIDFIDEDSYYYIDFEFTDLDLDSVIWALLTNASWLAIDPLSGELEGTPENIDVGSYWVNITIDDGNGGFDSLNFSLTVNNTNDAPLITTSYVDFVWEDSFYYVDYNFTDDDHDPVTWVLTTDASWLSFDPVTGELWGTPQNNDVGSYFVNITIDDVNGGMDYSNYTLTVSNTNDPPQIIAIYVEYINEDSYYYVDYNFTDIDLDTVVWSIETNASWLSIDRNTGELSGTPQNADVGEFYVNVTANDGNGGIDHQFFTVTVNNTNDAPYVPQLYYPADDSMVNTTFPRFTWNTQGDQDKNDYVASFTLQFSTTSDFSDNITTITGLNDTTFTPFTSLMDDTTYFWRVEAFDSNLVGSGYQNPHYVFTIDTGYEPPVYNGRLKSVMIPKGETWAVDLDAYFELRSLTEGITFTASHNDIKIDAKTHIATWTPRNENSQLTDVTFTISDGITEVTSQPIDLSVEREMKAQTLMERIFWPYPLIPMLLLMILAGAVMVKKWKQRPFIEEVFFISENGRLISHASVYNDEEVDEDILSGMLTGVKDLITDAFIKEDDAKEEKGLHKLEFGESNIMLEKGNHFFIALVFKGVENKKMFSKIKSAIAEIEERYGDVLADWDGDMDAFKGADVLIYSLLSQELLKENEKAQTHISRSESDEKIIDKWSNAMVGAIDGEESVPGQDEEPYYEEEGEEEIEYEDDDESPPPPPPPSPTSGLSSTK